MTWVVGIGTMMGYAFALSDVRVTFVDRSERDCLQKIYPVGPYLAAAFAGSVQIGFEMIENLSRFLSVPNDEAVAWDPGWVAERWPTEACKVFAAQSSEEQQGKSHVMLLGVHPTEHDGNPEWGRSQAYVFKSPDFQPIRAKPHELLAIGCGVQIPEFQSALQEVSINNDTLLFLMDGEQNQIGGLGTMLAIHLTSLLEERQPRGISSHLHLCWVQRGQIVIRANDYRRTGAWSAWPTGPEIGSLEDASFSANFKMPRIASSYSEFIALCRESGQTAAGAIT